MTDLLLLRLPAAVTCEDCGYRNLLERRVLTVPETIFLICHNCERPLSVDITPAVREALQHAR